MTKNSTFKIAQITAAHGIRGEVKVVCFLENPDDLPRYNPLSTRQGKEYSLAVTGHVKGNIIARIEGIADRNEAELLRGLELYAPGSKLPKKSENEFYQQELIGLSAIDASGKAIGNVLAIHNFGAGDIIEISTSEGDVMLPFKAPFVGEIDVKKGTMHITLPEYLGDENP